MRIRQFCWHEAELLPAVVEPFSPLQPFPSHLELHKYRKNLYNIEFHPTHQQRRILLKLHGNVTITFTSHQM